MNLTICEKVWSMFSYAKLLKIFWHEIVINLSPAYALEMDIPEHVLTGKDISYKHVKVFKCRASTHIPKDERASLMVRLDHAFS